MGYPGDMASYREVDAWLEAGGWVRDGRAAWRLMRGRRITVATHEEAVKMQKRREAAAKRQPNRGTR
jgi:hypothetical protein